MNDAPQLSEHAIRQAAEDIAQAATLIKVERDFASGH